MKVFRVLCKRIEYAGQTTQDVILELDPYEEYSLRTFTGEQTLIQMPEDDFIADYPRAVIAQGMLDVIDVNRFYGDEE